jgi:hypothetical protein
LRGFFYRATSNHTAPYVTVGTLLSLLAFVGVFIPVDVLLVEVQPLFASLTDFTVADERMSDVSMESTSPFTLGF